MRLLRLAGPFLAFVAASAAYGCMLDVSGLDVSAGGAGPTSVTASSGPGGASSSSGSGVVTTSSSSNSSTVSAGSTSSTGCATSTEDCNDGVDNNCDGKIDCDDPQCQGVPTGRECVAPAPSGWKVVTYAPDAAATCSNGYDGPASVAPVPGSDGTVCKCNCGAPTVNPCVQGKLTVKMGIIACGGNTYTPDATGACDSLNTTVTNDYATAIGVPPVAKQVACVSSADLPDPQPGAVGVTCSPLPSIAGGCMNGATCLPKVTSAGRCIQAAGDMACPAGPFSKRHVVGDVGDVMDQRMCGACSCQSSATLCTNATFTGYNDAACTQHPVSVPLNGVCNPVNTSNFKDNKYFKYQATPDTMSCAPTGAAPSLSGAFALKNPLTLCCLP